MLFTICYPSVFRTLAYSESKAYSERCQTSIMKYIIQILVYPGIFGAPIYSQLFFLSLWVSFQEHLRFTGQQGTGKAISLIPLYHFHPHRRHFDISQRITAVSSPLHIASSWTRTRNPWFPSVSR